MFPFLLPFLTALGTSTLAQGALMGAATGAGITALTGGNRKDIGRAALGGALTGGVGAGISGLAAGSSMGQLAGLGEAATAAPSGLPVAEGIPNIIQNTALTGSNAPSVATNLMGGDPLSLAKLGAEAGPQTLTGGVNPMISQASTPAATTFSSGMANAGPTGVSNFMSDASSVLGAPGGGAPTSLFDNPAKYAMENKYLTGTSALAGMMAGQKRPEMPKRRKLEGLPIWEYQAKEGGITSLNAGGVSDLGSYSDGGRMLKGRGDGMSDSIPGVIAGKRPARLADGEFVVPADVVSHLGNGSTDAGAKQLYRMMDKVRAARTGTRKQGRQINPRRFMPA